MRHAALVGALLLSGCFTPAAELDAIGLDAAQILQLELESWPSAGTQYLFGAGSRPLRVHALRCSRSVRWSGDFQCYYQLDYERDGRIRTIRRSKVFSRDADGTWDMAIIISG